MRRSACFIIWNLYRVLILTHPHTTPVVVLVIWESDDAVVDRLTGFVLEIVYLLEYNVNG
jgi:hypothetical protein